VTNGVKVNRKLDHQDMPDPVADKCNLLENEISQLQERLEKLEESMNKEGNLQ
jgi:serine O-acetyltransferase